MAPAIFGEEYKTNFTNGTYAKLADVKNNVKFLWIGTGTSDFLISASRGLDAYLTEQGVKHTFYTPDGGHTWMNCRDYLTQIAQKLFK
jgi:enterochelin esterase-like enzyme